MGEVCRCSKSGDMNKLVEREGFIDFIRVKSAEMKYKFLFEVFTAFCVSLVQGMPADCHGYNGLGV